jgi:hypothetical protein
VDGVCGQVDLAPALADLGGLGAMPASMAQMDAIPNVAAYSRTSCMIYIEQNLRPHMLRKCAKALHAWTTLNFRSAGVFGRVQLAQQAALHVAHEAWNTASSLTSLTAEDPPAS